MDLRKLEDLRNLAGTASRPLQNVMRKAADLLKHGDHDHNTGKVRGLLHKSCNLIIGNSMESISLLGKAIEYLRKHTMEGSEIRNVKF